MSSQSAYIRYRASTELNGLVRRYINEMESDHPEPELDVLIAIMDKFVKESVETFVAKPAEHVQLSPRYLKMINSLCEMVEKSAMMLVHKVAKNMSTQDHINAAQYMKQVRLEIEEEGKAVGDIAFPIESGLADLGWETREKMLQGQAKDPAVVAEGVQFLHGVIDVANLWVFEKPVQILGLGPILRKLAVTTVSAVKKATHSLINTLVPRVSEQQIKASAEYFSGIVGPGPFAEEYGVIPQAILQHREQG